MKIGDKVEIARPKGSPGDGVVGTIKKIHRKDEIVVIEDPEGVLWEAYFTELIKPEGSKA